MSCIFSAFCLDWWNPVRWNKLKWTWVRHPCAKSVIKIPSCGPAINCGLSQVKITKLEPLYVLSSWSFLPVRSRFSCLRSRPSNGDILRQNPVTALIPRGYNNSSPSCFTVFRFQPLEVNNGGSEPWLTLLEDARKAPRQLSESTSALLKIRDMQTTAC